jgi:hypothetical protein
MAEPRDGYELPPGTSTRAFTLGLLAVAGFNAVLGIGVALAIAPHAWATDAERNLAAAGDLAAGAFGRNRGYLYSPLAAILTIPATWLPAGLAIGGWLLARLAVLAEGIRRETRGWRPVDRVSAAVATVMFVPTLYDLMLGNVTILLAAGVAVVAWSRDRASAGIVLGLLLATVPKPAVVPILVWMLIYRRRALLGTALTAVAASALTAAILGTGPYLAWFDILRRPEYLDSPQFGNLSLTALPTALAVVIGVAALAGTLLALRMGEAPGFVAVLAAGLVLAPYTMAYGPVMLLIAFRPLLWVAPVRTFLLAITGSLLVIVFLPAWALAWIATAVSVPRVVWSERMSTVAR